MTLIYFIIVLGILIFVHELGHFIMAKRAGIRVEKFSLGFGPKLIGFRKGETEYLISALPLGGYVKMTGEDPEESKGDDPNSFSNKPIAKRFGVVVAGPVMNIILTIILMPAVFMIGRMEPKYISEPPVVIGVEEESPAETAGFKKGDLILTIDGVPTANWKDAIDFVVLHPEEAVDIELERAGRIEAVQVRIGSDNGNKVGFLGVEPGLFIGNEPKIDLVAPDGPADEAGLKKGDVVASINGKEVKTWTRMSTLINDNKGAVAALEFVRGGEKISLKLKPKYDEGAERWLIGIRKDLTQQEKYMVKRQYPFFSAIEEGFKENIRLTAMTLTVLGRLVSFKLSYKSLGGPVRIAQASGVAAKSGLSGFIFFLAFLSLQLGVLNLLPIPILDGGHVLFFFIEAIKKKPLSVKIRFIAQNAGLALIVSLIVLITWNDLDSIFGIGRLVGKMKNFF